MLIESKYKIGKTVNENLYRKDETHTANESAGDENVPEEGKRTCEISFT